MTEQERAAKAYAASREQRDREGQQIARDNARIDGNGTSGSNPGGAR